MESTNYRKIQTFFPWKEEYVYVDRAKYLADRIFDENRLRVKYLHEFIKKNSEYRIIFCRIWKRDHDKWVKSMEQLHRDMLLLGNTDYPDICKEVCDLLQKKKNMGDIDEK